MKTMNRAVIIPIHSAPVSPPVRVLPEELFSKNTSEYEIYAYFYISLRAVALNSLFIYTSYNLFIIGSGKCNVL